MGGPHKIVSGRSDVDPIFSLTLKKPKENQSVQLQPLKILRKINDFHLIATLGSLGANKVPQDRPGSSQGSLGSPRNPWGPPLEAPGDPSGQELYTQKLPINRRTRPICYNRLE